MKQARNSHKSQSKAKQIAQKKKQISESKENNLALPSSSKRSNTGNSSDLKVIVSQKGRSRSISPLGMTKKEDTQPINGRTSARKDEKFI